MFRGILAAVLAFGLSVLPAAGQRRDSVYTASEQFRWQKLIAPVSLMGVGSVCAFLPAYQNGVNVPVRDWVVSKTGGEDLKFDNFLQFAPSAAYVVAAIAGAGKHSLWEQAVTGATAYLLMLGTVQGVKYLTANPRPNGSARSFPSGHTATAFLGAELIRLEYGPWWGLAAYSVAASVGFFRVWNNWHWTSDVVAGAGFGILCANAAYWLLPLERKLFGMDSKLSGASHYSWQASPFVVSMPTGACYGLTMSIQW